MAAFAARIGASLSSAVLVGGALKGPADNEGGEYLGSGLTWIGGGCMVMSIASMGGTDDGRDRDGSGSDFLGSGWTGAEFGPEWTAGVVDAGVDIFRVRGVALERVDVDAGSLGVLEGPVIGVALAAEGRTEGFPICGNGSALRDKDILGLVAVFETELPVVDDFRILLVTESLLDVLALGGAGLITPPSSSDSVVSTTVRFRLGLAFGEGRFGFSPSSASLSADNTVRFRLGVGVFLSTADEEGAGGDFLDVAKTAEISPFPSLFNFICGSFFFKKSAMCLNTFALKRISTQFLRTSSRSSLMASDN